MVPKVDELFCYRYVLIERLPSPSGKISSEPQSRGKDYSVYEGQTEHFPESLRGLFGHIRSLTELIANDFQHLGTHFTVSALVDDLSKDPYSSGSALSINFSYLPKSAISERDLKRMPTFDSRRASLCASFSISSLAYDLSAHVTCNN
jgi:hypothetical protein